MEKTHLDTAKLQVDGAGGGFQRTKCLQAAQLVAELGARKLRLSEQVEIHGAPVAKLERQTSTARKIKTFECGPGD